MSIIIRIIDLLLILSSHATITVLCQTEAASITVTHHAFFVQLHIALLIIFSMWLNSSCYIDIFKNIYLKYIIFSCLIIVVEPRCNVGFKVSKVNREYNS